MRGEEGADISQVEARQILERRAKALAQPLETPEATGRTVDLVTFSCAGSTYAVEASHVVGVVPLTDPTPLPGTPPAVLGVVNHRGRIVSVVDVGRLLARSANETPEGGVLVMLTVGESSFAIRTDSAPEIAPVDERDVVTSGGLVDEQDSVVRGITGALVAILDVEAMARDPRIAVDDQLE